MPNSTEPTSTAHTSTAHTFTTPTSTAPTSTTPTSTALTSTPLAPLREVNHEPAEPTLIRVVGLLNAIFQRFTYRDWRQMDKIPTSGGVVFVVNHISNLDPISVGQFLAYAGRWPHYLGKASLFRIPVVGRIITACGQIPVERHTRDAATALTRAVEAVAQGRSISIFPEGTITLDPQLWPMTAKTGAARIALATGCPVVPVGQWGVQDIMYGKVVSWPKLLPRKTIRMLAGDPVELDDLRAQSVTPAVLREATMRIMAAITALVAELREEKPPNKPFDPRTSLEDATATNEPVVQRGDPA